MVSLSSLRAALAFFNSGQLLEFAVKLLNLPASGTRILCGIQGILSQVICNNPVRAVFGNLDPEQFRFVLFWKTLDLHSLAAFLLGLAPGQIVNTAVQPLSVAVIHLPVVTEWAVIVFSQRLDEQHQILLGVLGVHQQSVKGRLLGGHQCGEYLSYMIKLGLAAPVRIENSVIHHPVRPTVRIDVQTVDHPYAFDQSMGISTVLPTHQLDTVGVILVQDRIIKHETPTRRLDYRALNVFPNQSRAHFVLLQKLIYRVMTNFIGVIRIIRNRKINVNG